MKKDQKIIEKMVQTKLKIRKYHRAKENDTDNNNNERVKKMSQIIRK